MLTAHGWDCRVFCGPQLDFEEHRPLVPFLTAGGVPHQVRHGACKSVPFSVARFRQGGVPVLIYDAPLSDPRQPPGRLQGNLFLRLFDEVLAHFRPDLLLLFGGHRSSQEAILHAKQQGVRVVFALHNFAYDCGDLFRSVDGVVVPSRYAQEHYRRELNLETAVLRPPGNWQRLLCPAGQGRYLTFINPQPEKGVFVVARIAHELGQRRPDIPILIVESRADTSWLAKTGLDLSQFDNLFLIANTPDPREFLALTRIMLVPSLWKESFGRVALEAFINGIPVVASRRGALAETLGEAGILIDVPEKYTPESRLVPSTEEVTPWLDAIIRLWDDADYYADQSRRSKETAEAWRPERLIGEYEDVLLKDIHPRPTNEEGQAQHGNLGGTLLGDWLLDESWPEDTADTTVGPPGARNTGGQIRPLKDEWVRLVGPPLTSTFWVRT
jgi:glycosyltransferase involved in cell wall biosynthesis